MTTQQPAKKYIGDGVYVHYDGFHVVLTTNNGIYDLETIYLDPNVITELLRFIESLSALKPQP